jgi:hypothetical protein
MPSLLLVYPLSQKVRHAMQASCVVTIRLPELSLSIVVSAIVEFQLLSGLQDKLQLGTPAAEACVHQSEDSLQILTLLAFNLN